MVCGNCALPLGKGASVGGPVRRRLPRFSLGSGRGRIWRWALPLGLLLLVSAHLAQLSSRDGPAWTSPDPVLR
jgi:hypothetical protein